MTPKTPASAAKSDRKSSRRKPSRAGAGRPTAARVEAINNAILGEARTEFSRAGYENTRMEAIAKAAGVSKGTLYDRYPTKEALLRAVIAERVTAWSQDWGSVGGPMPADLRDRLKHRSRDLMEFLCSGELELIERLLSSSPSMDQLRRIRYEVGHQRTAQVIAQEIIDGTPDQPIQPRTAMRLAETLIGMLYGWWRMQQEVRHVTFEEGCAYADHAVDVLFDGRSAWAQAAR